MQKIPMTKKGFELLQEELKTLKNVERPSVIKAIADAREHGDLSENAEYHAARERQGFVEGRILVLEDRLSRSEVIDVKKISCDTIKFGATITLRDEDTDEKHHYQIVGSDEADVKSGLISITAPLSKAMINKKINDYVEVLTPNGQKVYTILEVLYV
jgi:transcription elongation factor GreA